MSRFPSSNSNSVQGGRDANPVATPTPARAIFDTEDDSGSPPFPTQEDLSAGGVVVRLVDGRWHALLIRDPFGKWGLPKGHLEGEETAREAALREVEEETGLEIRQVGPRLGTIEWTFWTKRNRMVHKRCAFFLMHSEGGEPRPQKAEGISACSFVPLANADRRVSYGNTRPVVRRAARLLEEDPSGPWAGQND